MIRFGCVLAIFVLGAIMAAPVASYPRYSSNYYLEEGPYEPEDIMEMLNRLDRYMQLERKMADYKDAAVTSDKRALDLGLNRGYSGALHAKHMMGVAAANYAGGPGRRRRDAQ
ncbi:diuretic hormone class 2 [Leptidea sinapis]|uniref:diuretic hormone class 2 n=1 Tax=Leptidea sinapis TaxID=189913 RepID=UPI002125966D|nr:diuretic hormone class 2 [Leptidea sinapis]